MSDQARKLSENILIVHKLNGAITLNPEQPQQRTNEVAVSALLAVSPQYQPTATHTNNISILLRKGGKCFPYLLGINPPNRGKSYTFVETQSDLGKVWLTSCSQSGPWTINDNRNVVGCSCDSVQISVLVIGTILLSNEILARPWH